MSHRRRTPPGRYASQRPSGCPPSCATCLLKRDPRDTGRTPDPPGHAHHRPNATPASRAPEATPAPSCSVTEPSGTEDVPRTSPLAPLGLDSGVYRSPLSRPSLNGQPNTSLLPSCSLSHPTCLVSHTGRGGMSPAIGRGAPDQTMAAGALISGTAHQREGLGLCAEAPAGAASTGTGKPPEGAARGPS